MKKIPFDIKYRPQIESGEYKVVTYFNRPARIICWDANEGSAPLVVLLEGVAEHYTEIGSKFGALDNRLDLFILIPDESETTEFDNTSTPSQSIIQGKDCKMDDSWVRFTVICSDELVQKIKFIAHEEDFNIREVVEKSFRNTINSYEQKTGKKIIIKNLKKKDINSII